MQWIYIICFALISAGLLALFGVRPGDFIDALFRVKDCFNSYPLDRVCQTVCAAAVGIVDLAVRRARKKGGERK